MADVPVALADLILIYWAATYNIVLLIEFYCKSLLCTS